MAPRAAAIEIAFITTALNGSTTERGTTREGYTSMTPTTANAIHGSRLPRLSRRSTSAAGTAL